MPPGRLPTRAMNISHLIDTYGYWAVFAFVAAESLGVPIPGETALIAAGAYAGDTHRLNPWVIFAVAAVAAVAGNIVGYIIGWKGGFALASRYGTKSAWTSTSSKWAVTCSTARGARSCFSGASYRCCAPTLPSWPARCAWAGAKFVVATVAGAVVWAAVYAVLSYKAAATLKRLSLTFDLILGGLAVAVVVGVVLVTRRQLKALGEKAEAAYPGSLR